MKKVKFLLDTAYQGPRKEGDILNVPDDFAKRWAKNGIAEIIGEGEVPAPVEDTVEETPAEEAIDYSSMSAKDLYAACKEKGIEVEAKKSKDYYIEQLTTNE